MKYLEMDLNIHYKNKNIKAESRILARRMRASFTSSYACLVVRWRFSLLGAIDSFGSFLSHTIQWNRLVQGSTKTRLQVCRASRLCTKTPSLWGSLVWNLLRVILLKPWILRWFLDFWKICASLGWCLSPNQKNPIFEYLLTICTNN